MIHFYKEVLKFQMFYCFDMNFIFVLFFLLFSWKPGFHLNYSVDSQKKTKKAKTQKTTTTNRRMHNFISRNISISHFTIGEKETWNGDGGFHVFSSRISSQALLFYCTVSSPPDCRIVYRFFPVPKFVIISAPPFMTL